MERRTLLKTVGGIGAVGALGGLSLFASTGVSAQSTWSITSTSMSNDDGDLSQVGVQANHELSWDGFDKPVEALAYKDVVRKVDSDGNVVASSVVYDSTNNPVMLSNWSSQGNGSDGWGGPGEYTSGPGTTGNAHVDIDWTVIAESDSAANSVEDPAPAADFDMDNDSDGTDKDNTIEYVKEVHLYSTQSGSGYTTDDGTSVGKMGGDDGTVGVVSASDTFTVTVTNEGSGTSTTGGGSSSAS